MHSNLHLHFLQVLELLILLENLHLHFLQVLRIAYISRKNDIRISIHILFCWFHILKDLVTGKLVSVPKCLEPSFTHSRYIYHYAKKSCWHETLWAKFHDCTCFLTLQAYREMKREFVPQTIN